MTGDLDKRLAKDHGESLAKPRTRLLAPQGSFVYIPAGVVHGFRVGNSRSRKLNLYIPAAMVGYFDELAALPSGPGNEERLANMAERYGMRVVGPVPDGYI